MLPGPRKKWRPTLIMIVAAIIVAVLTLPLAGLIFFRPVENLLIHQTENELISQSAALAAVMENKIAGLPAGSIPMGPMISKPLRRNTKQPNHPIEAQLDLNAGKILGPRPDPQSPAQSPHASYAPIGQSMLPILVSTQRITLAGFRVLDPFGTVIAGRSDIGLSLAHVPEVKGALAGRYTSVLRQRISDEPPPPYHSISRGTGIRIFIALPVIVDDRVAGIIYASRTPSNILKELYLHRNPIILAAIIVLAVTLTIGFIFARAIAGPIHELIRRTRKIGRGDLDAVRPLKHHGSREVADLSHSFLEMADKLSARTDYISNFAVHVSHELKSPLTSIQGAAELLRDSQNSMTKAERHKFLDNITSDAQRLTTLVQRLRELARADNPQTGGTCVLADAVEDVKQGFGSLSVEFENSSRAARAFVVPMSNENTRIVLKHLLENALQHRAGRVSMTGTVDNHELVVHLNDDGEGVSPENQSRIFDAFFTTNRESGGTGMGLGIVNSMLRAHGGSIHLIPSIRGASFELRLPVSR